MHRLYLRFQVEQCSALSYYSLFPTYPHSGSRRLPFSAFFALHHHPLIQKTTIVRSFPEKKFRYMTSADFLQLSHTSLHGFFGYHGVADVFRSLARPPPLRTITFPSYICYIYTAGFEQYWTLFWSANSSALHMPCMYFLFVRPRVCIRLTSDSASRRTPLPSANSSYCQACSGLSPPSYRPFGANQKKRPVHKVPVSFRSHQRG